MLTYYLVFLSNGTTSNNLLTIPDVASWIEDNWDAKCKHASIKEVRIDRDKLVKETEKDIQRCEARVNKLQEKLKKIKIGG